jgi:ribosome maturation protein SDO1
MISLNDAIVVKYDHGDHHYEVLVDPDIAYEIKEKKDISLLENFDDVVASYDVYKDAHKGERASEEEVEKHFGSNDKKFIFFKIITNGELHPTTEQRRKMQEEKKKKIIATIVAQSIDPTTNTPHPPARIERAMEQAGIHIDPLKPVEKQVNEIVDKLRPIIPTKIAKAKIELKIPAEHASRVFGYLKQLKPLKTEWKNDGSLEAVIEIPAGMQTEVFDKLNDMTHGNIYSKVMDIV